MSVMFEVFYAPPRDSGRETQLIIEIAPFGGRLTYIEEDGIPGGAICLTFEFDDWQQAERAVVLLRERGNRVYGPMEYGDR